MPEADKGEVDKKFAKYGKEKNQKYLKKIRQKQFAKK